jgi:HD superfamily phosphohydrolase
MGGKRLRTGDMAKSLHEIRDPIHVFVRLDSHEREVLNSRFFQRLRHIHQLALTYLVYPGATHKRFEHSLGVMELAGRVFDVVTEHANDEMRARLEPLNNPDERRYWRRVVRMAALCHDVGHLPFSHAAEKQLLPDGWDHERLTREIILSTEMTAIWNRITPPLRPDDIVKLAVGPKKAKDLRFSEWEEILSEIIVGDAFGVDRMDYLLRDSHHVGVAYGKFDAGWPLLDGRHAALPYDR